MGFVSHIAKSWGLHSVNHGVSHVSYVPVHVCNGGSLQMSPSALAGKPCGALTMPSETEAGRRNPCAPEGGKGCSKRSRWFGMQSHLSLTLPALCPVSSLSHPPTWFWSSLLRLSVPVSFVSQEQLDTETSTTPSETVQTAASLLASQVLSAESKESFVNAVEMSVG